MDPNSGLIVLGTAVGSAKLLEKLLGPTADYIGMGVKTWAEKRVNNVVRILDHGKKKLGERIEKEGAVPPKVLKTILDDGSFADDELTGEYFGGVLASSRSEVSRDDRGAVFAALVGRLSTYQIRAHYYFYRLVKEIFDGDSLNPGLNTDRTRMRVFVPLHAFAMAMDFSAKEDVGQIVAHVLVGLANEDLIEGDYSSGPKGFFGAVVEAGIVFRPSGLGVELFLWAHGRGDLRLLDFLTPDITFVSETKIDIASGYFALDKIVDESVSAAASDS